MEGRSMSLWVSTLNGSGGRRKKEVWFLYGCRPLVRLVLRVETRGVPFCLGS
jgi:hypothetical protein